MVFTAVRKNSTFEERTDVEAGGFCMNPCLNDQISQTGHHAVPT